MPFQKVYLAGDNDIGGEGEYVIDSRRERFRKRYGIGITVG